MDLASLQQQVRFDFVASTTSCFISAVDRDVGVDRLDVSESKNTLQPQSLEAPTFG